MEDRLDTSPEGIVRWLLEPEQPSVRYLALRELLGHSADDPTVLATRADIARSPAMERIFSHQAADGAWGDPENPYLPKYRSTYWTVMLLGYLGMSREDERVQRAVEFVFRFQQPNGGFAEYGREGARQEYLYVARSRQARGKAAPDEQTFLTDLVHQMTLSCLTGNVVSALLRLGYDGDPRVWRAIDWLAGIQTPDGGWLCPYWKAHVRDRHSCFSGTLCALEAFSEIPESRRTQAWQEAAARGAEFLLMHHLYRADHHDWKVIKPDWLRLSFPFFWGYSTLRALWILTRLGYRDERMQDALAVLSQKRLEDGRWPLESTPWGRMQVNLERKGEASKWLTLMAWYVLQRAGSVRGLPQ